MSMLEKLIQEYCPNGVEWKPFAEVFETITDYTAAGSFKNIADNVQYLKEPDYAMLIRTTDLKSNFTKGGFVYVSQSAFNYLWRVNMDKECIVMPNVGNCGEVYYVQPQDLPYEHCALAPNAILVRSNTQNNKYLSYCLQVEDFQKQLAKITSPVGQSKFNKTELKKLVLPIPPLPVQEEIVRLLDTFTSLQTELQTELIKRKEQYQHYQGFLLNKSHFSRHLSIGELCEVKKGNTAIQKAKEGIYPLVVTTMERKSCDEYQFNANAVCIPLVSSRGHGIASLNHVYYQEGRFALGNILCAVIPSDETVLKAKFLFYYLEYTKDYTLVPLMKGGANVSMHCSDIEKVKIPVPSIQDQVRIISILDKFDTLANDFLPTEIEKRRQQFEYYRDKLLTFKRKEA